MVPPIDKENMPQEKKEDKDLHAMEVMDKMRVKMLITRLRSIPSEAEFKIMLEEIRQEEKVELESHVPKLDEKFIEQKCEEVVRMAQEELVELKTKTLQSYIGFHQTNILSQHVINYLQEANITLDDLERLKKLIKEKGLGNSNIDPYAEDGFIKTAEKMIKSRSEMTMIKPFYNDSNIEAATEPKKVPRVR